MQPALQAMEIPEMPKSTYRLWAFPLSKNIPGSVRGWPLARFL